MIQKQFPSDQDIINCLHTHYNLAITALTNLSLGADLDAHTYKAQTSDQTSYFIKLKRSHHDLGAQISSLLQVTGIKHILAPIPTIKNESCCYIDGCTLMVYPFIEGLDGFSKPLTDDQWIILGSTLKKIHSLNVPISLTQKIPTEIFSPNWRNAVRLLYAHIDARNIASDEIATQHASYMLEHRTTIEHIVQRAHELGEKLCQQSLSFVLCHADIHGGNVLLSKNDMLYIIDWDAPIMAPKERDLMFIGGGVGNIWNSAHEETLFYQGYGKTEIHNDALAYYRYERIVQDIAEYGQALLLTANGGDERAVMLKHFIDMFEPRGVIDIACTTDSAS